MALGTFFLIVGTLGAVILIIVIFAYRREKASVDKRLDVKKDNDWLDYGLAILAIVLVVCGWVYHIYNQDEETKSPIEEDLHTEEFSYKGHQYIMFRTYSRLDGASVVHDPNCECHLKTDSI